MQSKMMFAITPICGEEKELDLNSLHSVKKSDSLIKAPRWTSTAGKHDIGSPPDGPTRSSPKRLDTILIDECEHGIFKRFAFLVINDDWVEL